MSTRFIENKAALHLFLLKESSRYPHLDEEDWLTITTLQEILDPLYKATNYVQARNASISTVLPAFFVLRRKLREAADGGKYSDIKKRILMGLENRMDGWKSKKFLTMATALDPRFQLKFFDESDKDLVVKCLKEEAIQMASLEYHSDAEVIYFTNSNYDSYLKR